jgi:hypothetical protein
VQGFQDLRLPENALSATRGRASLCAFGGVDHIVARLKTFQSLAPSNTVVEMIKNVFFIETVVEMVKK